MIILFFPEELVLLKVIKCMLKGNYSRCTLDDRRRNLDPIDTEILQLCQRACKQINKYKQTS